ncbi:hypothetical protein KIPB_009599, partial [Kipferlia bialata]
PPALDIKTVPANYPDKFDDGIMRRWQCLVCGEVIVSVNRPDICNVCDAGAEAFVLLGELEMVRAEDGPQFEGTLVVLGAGPAGAMAAQSARERCPGCKIIVVGAEATLPYNRTKLSHALQQGDLLSNNAAGLVLHDAEWYAERNIEIRLNSRVGSVDTYAKTISVTSTVDDTTQDIPYDRVILCTGANPFVSRGLIQLDGEEIKEPMVKNISFMRTTLDMEGLRATIGAVETPVHAAMIGGGVLSLEALPALVDSLPKGSSVSILQGSDHVLSAQLNHEYSAHFVKNLNEHVEGRVNFVLNSRAQRVECVKDANGDIRDILYIAHI